MGFSYNTDTATAVNRDYVRFSIDDKVEDYGPLPSGVNFTDDELDMIIELEGSWQRAVAACFEALHAAWAKHVSWTADGMSISQSHVADEYRMLAEKQRKAYGGVPGATARARSVIKVDGYSQDIASDEVT